MHFSTSAVLAAAFATGTLAMPSNMTAMSQTQSTEIDQYSAYFISNSVSGSGFIDLFYGKSSCTPATAINLYPNGNAGDSNRIWVISKTGVNNIIQIVHKATGIPISCSGSATISPALGGLTAVNQWSQFILVSLSPGTVQFQLLGQVSGKTLCLDNKGAGTGAGNPVQCYPCWDVSDTLNSPAQKWNLMGITDDSLKTRGLY